MPPARPDAAAYDAVMIELFLPSYAKHGEAQHLETKQDPVEDIVLTDEEADAMLPQ